MDLRDLASPPNEERRRRLPPAKRGHGVRRHRASQKFRGPNVQVVGMGTVIPVGDHADQPGRKALFSNLGLRVLLFPESGAENRVMAGAPNDTNDSPPSDRVPATETRMTRNEIAVITSVDETMTDVLGWRPEEMVGQPSTTFVHPEDQPSAVAAWFQMREAPGSIGLWRGRYRTVWGDWQWVETENTNALDNSDEPRVYTVMRRFTPERAGFAEELRSRKQLLNRLADAVPVGIFQIETKSENSADIAFTNDRFLDMFGPEAAATVQAQFARVLPEDLPVLWSALERVLDDQPVDDLEFRFRHPGDRRRASPRVCQLSLRPLTDDAGNVTGAIGCVSDVTESVELRRELELRAAVDGLTG